MEILNVEHHRKNGKNYENITSDVVETKKRRENKTKRGKRLRREYSNMCFNMMSIISKSISGELNK